MLFDWSSWFSLVPFEPSRLAPPGQRSLNIIPESWKPVSHWKMVFDGCAWFSVVPFEPSWQVPPGQISLNIILESWKPVSHWKMVFDGCAWFLLFFLNPVGKLPQGKDPWILSRSLERACGSRFTASCVATSAETDWTQVFIQKNEVPILLINTRPKFRKRKTMPSR